MGLSDQTPARLGVVVAVQANKITVSVGLPTPGTPAAPKRLQLPSRQVHLLCPLPSGASPPDRLGVFPWQLDEARLKQALPPLRDFSAAWLLLQEGAETPGLPLMEWIDLVAQDPSPAAIAASWLWLQGPQLFYRQRQELIEARPTAEVRRLRHERHRVRLLEQKKVAWQRTLQQRQPLDRGQLNEAEQADLDQLLAWASGDTEQPLPLSLRQALQKAGCSAEQGSIRHLLVDLGQWDPHQLATLRQSTWELGFSCQIEAEAQQLAAIAEQEQPGDAERIDLTRLWAVTIDDSTTRELDDGLSLEHTPEGALRLWIHVADPGRLVLEGSPLDLEARRRGTSLYLAQGSLPMFPVVLSHGPFSLRAGQRNAAWSIWVELDQEGAVGASGCQRSWVKPTYRLTYDDADELIDLAPPQEAQLADMHELMERRRRWRVQQGALLMDQSEGRIRTINGVADLEITEPGPSRTLVAEAMILAGAVVADVGRRHGLALPYRSQLPAALPSPTELAALPPGPVRHAALKRCLSRGITGTEPANHFSLGLSAYVQATSPIRRYGDLVVQRQLAAHLSGATPRDSTSLMELLQEIESGVRQAAAISREDQRHWQQIWFEGHRQETWPAVFLRWLRPQDHLGLVHVEALAMDLAASCPSGSEPADSLTLAVAGVDALSDHLQLRALPA